MTKKIYRNVPVLIYETKGDQGNPWGCEILQNCFSHTSDGALFKTSKHFHESEDNNDVGSYALSNKDAFAPLYEAKFVGFYDHRMGSYESRGTERGYRVLPETPLESYQNINYFITPFNWVPLRNLEERLEKKCWNKKWILGWRDVTSATNERTVISSIIPRYGCDDTFSLLFPNEINIMIVHCLLGNINSIVFNYAARQKVGGLHLRKGTFIQLPILPPNKYHCIDNEFIASRVLELTYTANDIKPFAEDLGYHGPPFRWDPDRRALLRAELDAYQHLHCHHETSPVCCGQGGYM